MRKIFCVIFCSIAGIAALCLGACGSNEGAAFYALKTSFTSEYGEKEFKAEIVKNTGELLYYSQRTAELVSFDSDTSAYSDGNKSINSHFHKYDTAFFKEKYLVLKIVESGTTSGKPILKSVKIQDGFLRAEVSLKMLDTMTAANGVSLFILEMPISSSCNSADIHVEIE